MVDGDGRGSSLISFIGVAEAFPPIDGANAHRKSRDILCIASVGAFVRP